LRALTAGRANRPGRGALQQMLPFGFNMTALPGLFSKAVWVLGLP